MVVVFNGFDFLGRFLQPFGGLNHRFLVGSQ